jgi:hypothetical protein
VAARRMFSLNIINSARFLKMPTDAQNLYFHLGLRADDDGIVEAYSVMTQIRSSDDNLRILHAKGFVYVLNEDLVTYITDWKEHNNVRADRKIDSIYKNLLVQVLPEVAPKQAKPRSDVKDNSKRIDMDGPRSDHGPHRLGKVRLGKDRLGQVIESLPQQLVEPKEIKICNKCNTEKVLSDFGTFKKKDKKHYYNTCITCKSPKHNIELLQEKVEKYVGTNEELKITIFNFIKHRELLKKPLSDIALELLFKELNKHQDKISVINQSIVNGWQGIFELKNTQTKQSGSGNVFLDIGKEEGAF